MKPVQHGLRISAGTLTGKEICRLEDDLGYIIITQHDDKRVLNFGSGLEQSSVLMTRPYHLIHEYTQIMLLGLIFVDAKHITLPGLGGGGLVHCLSHYYPQLTIQVVELRQAVIDVAYEWFNLPRTDNLQIHHGDAYQYMRNAEPESTDLILCDLYQAQGMSEVQAHKSFIEACLNTLSDQGWLVINLHHLPEDDSELMQQLKLLFAEIYICDVFTGNWIMFCGKSYLELNKTELGARVKQMAKNVEMPLMYYFKQFRQIM